MIAQLGDEAAVTVRLNPADLALLGRRLGGRPLSDEYSDPKFVADPALGRGDCQVEGPRVHAPVGRGPRAGRDPRRAFTEPEECSVLTCPP
jgi:hypothetical protein